jgi:hypothetical protein
MITLVLLSLLFQNPPPTINYPPGFTGGADIATLSKMMEAVRAGTMPDEVQTPPPAVVIAPGAPLQLEWDYTIDPNRPVQFRLWVDGAIVRNFVSSDLVIAGNVVTTKAGVVAPFTTAQRGTRTLAVTAFDAEGDSPRSDNQLNVIVGFGTVPPSPSGLRIKVGGI